VLGVICEEPNYPFDVLASNGQLDLRRLLHVLHPLAIYVRRTDVKPVAIQNEPDRNFVRLPGFAPVMGQPRRMLSGYLPQSRKFGRFHKLSLAIFHMNQHLPLNVAKLFLGHPKIVPQFMYESLADLMTHFGLARADRLNILLIKHNVIWSCGEVEDAPLRCRHAVKDAQKQPPLLPQLGWSLVRRKIFNEDRDVLDADAELFRQRIQSLFCNLDEIFALHPSPLTHEERPHRVASVILFIVFIVVFRAVALVFLFFLVWLLSEEEISSYRPIKRVCVGAF
jgi:hypothetical protein